METKNHAGVYIPPPMIYAVFFLLAVLIQRLLPLDSSFLSTMAAKLSGWLLLVFTLIILLPSLWKFFRTHNTLITIKPARSLQTGGIYAFTRNPMYLGLLLLYAALACLEGNCWTLIFVIPFIIIQQYVILREEKYLERAFKQEFDEYRKKVRRWV